MCREEGEAHLQYRCHLVFPGQLNGVGAGEDPAGHPQLAERLQAGGEAGLRSSNWLSLTADSGWKFLVAAGRQLSGQPALGAYKKRSNATAAPEQCGCWQ